MRRRSGRARRGSVVVEALVVTPLFVVLCAMGFYAFRLHHERLALLRAVREPLWAAATTGGCRGDGVVTRASAAPAIEGGDLSYVPEMLPSGPNQGVVDRELVDGERREAKAVAGDPTFGAPERTLRAHASFPCNEPIESGRLTRMRMVAAESYRWSKPGGAGP